MADSVQFKPSTVLLNAQVGGDMEGKDSKKRRVKEDGSKRR
jgi:hypothetical protein